jgi:RluA family pseudouridine synthase
VDLKDCTTSHKNDYKWRVLPHDNGIRLVSFLSKHFLDENITISNKLIKYLIEQGLCQVNNRIECFATKKLSQDDYVELSSSWKSSVDNKKTKTSPITVLFEDQYYVFIDKPIGVVSEDKVLQKLLSMNCFLVHRLDKKTSGVLMLAKTVEYKNAMIPLFKKFKVDKFYRAIVDGEVKKEKGEIRSHIAKQKHFDGQTIYASDNSGKVNAITQYEVIERYCDCTLLQLKIISGKTHQLRVHMKEMNHSILGDTLYCKNFLYKRFVPRMMLHSYKMEFIHPYTNKKVCVKAPIPVYFEEIISD